MILAIRFSHHRRLLQALSLATIAAAVSATAPVANANEYVQTHCADCHTLSQPDYAALGFAERANRKGPHLHYAGDKYRKDWLRAWLEAPTRIRPGGSFPPDHTVVTDEGDVIDESTLPDHPAVPEEQLDDVVATLMSLHLDDAPTLEQPYEPKKISLMLGKMDFNKFKGCAACHRDDAENGGLSGPELYTAWQRLQPEFIVTYTASPTAWDPHSMMPNRHLKESDIHKLANYLKTVAEEAQ